jgi:hypothetical protein
VVIYIYIYIYLVGWGLELLTYVMIDMQPHTFLFCDLPQLIGTSMSMRLAGSG